MTFWGLTQTERKCVITNCLTRTRTHTHTSGLTSQACFRQFSTLPPTQHGVCSFHYQRSPLPHASALPVSNVNQSVGRGGGRGRKGGHATERPLGVSAMTAASAPSASSPPAGGLFGTFPAILIVYHQGNIPSHVCLIDWKLISIHLSAILSPFAILSLKLFWLGSCLKG